MCRRPRLAASQGRTTPYAYAGAARSRTRGGIAEWRFDQHADRCRLPPPLPLPRAQAYIKKEFDAKHAPTWHCIVGRNFGEPAERGDQHPPPTVELRPVLLSVQGRTSPTKPSISSTSILDLWPCCCSRAGEGGGGGSGAAAVARLSVAWHRIASCCAKHTREYWLQLVTNT